jgi:hypothetical protein
MNIQGHEDLPPLCVCCIEYEYECLCELQRACELESLPCNVVSLPFYSLREAHTRMLSPDMWAQEHNGKNTLCE